MSTFALPIAELKSALNGLGKVISRRPTLPILGQVKIERTKDGWIALTGTNLDGFATVRLEQPSEGELGTVLVSYDELAKTVKACGKGEAIIVETKDNNQAVLRYDIGNQEVENPIETLPVDEFPVIPRVTSDSFAIPDSLRASIHEAFACASTDETRYVITGAFIDVSQKDCHHVVGTNGRMLYSSNSFSLPLPESLIIPPAKFLQWKEFSNDGGWQMRLAEKDKEVTWLQISSRRWRYLTKPIEGNYPNWKQVVPDMSKAGTALEINTAGLSAIIQTIGQMPCHDQTNFTLGLEISGGKVRLLGMAPNAEQWAKVEIKDVLTKGRDLTIFVNRHFLSDALRFGLNQIEIIDPLSPLRLSNGGRQMIIMPVRTAVSDAAVKTPPPVAAETQPDPATDQNERKPMPEHNDTTNGATRSTPPADKPALETALAQIEKVKANYRDALTGLNELTGLLKQAAREHKANDKEVSSVRATLRSLQTVRL